MILAPDIPMMPDQPPPGTSQVPPPSPARPPRAPAGPPDGIEGPDDDDEEDRHRGPRRQPGVRGR
jgi:hypothetical protein